MALKLTRPDGAPVRDHMPESKAKRERRQEERRQLAIRKAEAEAKLQDSQQVPEVEIIARDQMIRNLTFSASNVSSYTTSARSKWLTISS